MKNKVTGPGPLLGNEGSRTRRTSRVDDADAGIERNGKTGRRVDLSTAAAAQQRLPRGAASLVLGADGRVDRRKRKAEGVAVSRTAPILVAVVPLAKVQWPISLPSRKTAMHFKDVDAQIARTTILEKCFLLCQIPDGRMACDVPFPGKRQRTWTVLPVLKSPQDTLELLKVFMTAELVVFVADGTPTGSGIDEQGLKALKLFKHIGVTSCITVFQNVPDGNVHQIAAAKKKIAEALKAEMGGDCMRVYPLLSDADGKSLLLHVQSPSVRVPHWRQQRPSLFVQSCEVYPPEQSTGTCALALRGRIRHAALSANQIISIGGHGDHLIEKILLEGPHPSLTCRPVIFPDPELQESLARENAAVREEEMQPEGAVFENAVRQQTCRVPKGTSDYQAAWIPGPEFCSESDTESPSQAMQSDTDLHGDIDDVRETQSVGRATDSDDLSFDEDAMETGDRAEEEEEEKHFPNEVRVPTDQLARIRFQHYRGLKSFRTSPWDAKADLPQHYARIFEFDSFSKAAKSAQIEISKEAWEDSVPVHSAVSLVLKDVPAEEARAIEAEVMRFLEGNGGPVLATGLMRHEVKKSVLHYRVLKAADYALPIVNRERFLFVSGFRWFVAAPLFSIDDPKYDKHQMEKFLQLGRHTIASVYGQIAYPPMPVLAFKLSSDLCLPPRLAFSGTLQSCAPERVILKHVILTGRVCKAIKKRAVVKGMFHNPEDVRWFKPLELWTKRGRTGYIKESLGTKGVMKCYFDGPIQHHDTICASLYKRVFPVWLDS